jgi:hypothetical protein
MAANDYYNPRPQQPHIQPYEGNSYSQQGGYGHEPELQIAPPYSSQSRTHQSPVSPFEGPFDDHVYPARPQDSQSSFAHDTSFHDRGRETRQDSFRDDIPLRDHVQKGNETDHVYDAPQQIPPDSDKRRSGAGRFFKKGKGRVAWVTYILTTIQVAVFIAEIVKNGKSYLFMGGTALTSPSSAYRLTHRDSPSIQSHDWTVKPSLNQYGGEICALYA